jgi:hypothetical protein
MAPVSAFTMQAAAWQWLPGQPARLKKSALAKSKDQDGAAVVAGASPPHRSVPVVVLSTSCQVLS